MCPEGLFIHSHVEVEISLKIWKTSKFLKIDAFFNELFIFLKFEVCTILFVCLFEGRHSRNFLEVRFSSKKASIITCTNRQTSNLRIQIIFVKKSVPESSETKKNIWWKIRLPWLILIGCIKCAPDQRGAANWTIFCERKKTNVW